MRSIYDATMNVLTWAYLFLSIAIMVLGLVGALVHWVWSNGWRKGRADGYELHLVEVVACAQGRNAKRSGSAKNPAPRKAGKKAPR